MDTLLDLKQAEIISTMDDEEENNECCNNLTKLRKNSPTSRSEYVVCGLNVSIIERVSRG